jgi:hypothetical protein
MGDAECEFSHNIGVHLPTVITSFVGPWVCGIGARTPQQAVGYIKTGKTLNSTYYPSMEGMTEDEIVASFDERLFAQERTDDNMSELVGETVYRPWDCLSARHQITIDDTMGIVARPNGVTKNYKTVVFRNTYHTEPNFSRYRQSAEQYMEAVSQLTMAIWRADRACYILEAVGDKVLTYNHCPERSAAMLQTIRTWSGKL